MPDDPHARHTQPETFLTDEFLIFDVEATPVSPGTKAPPRPPGKERRPGQELPVTEPFEIFECEAIPVPPGTPAPPRPPGRERSPVFRVAVPGTDPAAVDVVGELLRRVQRVVDGLPDDPAGLEALRRATAELPKAG
jgi:hypothetical protein